MEIDDAMEAMDELQKKLPPDFRPTGKETEAAYYLFGTRSGIQPDLRILVGSYERSGDRKPDRNYPTMRIILNNRLCLFFYGNTGKWVFDGYECGNYEGYWTEFDWVPEKKK